MGLLYGRTGCLTAQNGGFRPGQEQGKMKHDIGEIGRAINSLGELMQIQRASVEQLTRDVPRGILSDIQERVAIIEAESTIRRQQAHMMQGTHQAGAGESEDTALASAATQDPTDAAPSNIHDVEARNSFENRLAMQVRLLEEKLLGVLKQEDAAIESKLNELREQVFRETQERTGLSNALQSTMDERLKSLADVIDTATTDAVKEMSTLFEPELVRMRTHFNEHTGLPNQLSALQEKMEKMDAPSGLPALAQYVISECGTACDRKMMLVYSRLDGLQSGDVDRQQGPPSTSSLGAESESAALLRADVRNINLKLAGLEQIVRIQKQSATALEDEIFSIRRSVPTIDRIAETVKRAITAQQSAEVELSDVKDRLSALGQATTEFGSMQARLTQQDEKLDKLGASVGSMGQQVEQAEHVGEQMEYLKTGLQAAKQDLKGSSAATGAVKDDLRVFIERYQREAIKSGDLRRIESDLGLLATSVSALQGSGGAQLSDSTVGATSTFMADTDDSLQQSMTRRQASPSNKAAAGQQVLDEISKIEKLMAEKKQAQKSQEAALHARDAALRLSGLDREPHAVLGYDTTGDGQLDAFDTNQDGRVDTRAAASQLRLRAPGGREAAAAVALASHPPPTPSLALAEPGAAPARAELGVGVPAAAEEPAPMQQSPPSAPHHEHHIHHAVDPMVDPGPEPDGEVPVSPVATPSVGTGGASEGSRHQHAAVAETADSPDVSSTRSSNDSSDGIAGPQQDVYDEVFVPTPGRVLGAGGGGVTPSQSADEKEPDEPDEPDGAFDLGSPAASPQTASAPNPDGTFNLSRDTDFGDQSLLAGPGSPAAAGSALQAPTARSPTEVAPAPQSDSFGVGAAAATAAASGDWIERLTASIDSLQAVMNSNEGSSGTGCDLSDEASASPGAAAPDAMNKLLSDEEDDSGADLTVGSDPAALSAQGGGRFDQFDHAAAAAEDRAAAASGGGVAARPISFSSDEDDSSPSASPSASPARPAGGGAAAAGGAWPPAPFRARMSSAHECSMHVTTVPWLAAAPPGGGGGAAATAIGASDFDDSISFNDSGVPPFLRPSSLGCPQQRIAGHDDSAPVL
jgi:hypothetical protein